MRVKYTGPRSRIVAGKHMLQGEIRDLTEMQATSLRSDPDFVFLDEVQEAPEAPVLFGTPEEPQAKETDVPPPVNKPAKKTARKPRKK